jgi:hypothetical protein
MNVKKDQIKIGPTFLRLPRFPITLYETLLSTSKENFIETLRNNKFKEYLILLSNHTPYLYKSITTEKLTDAQRTTVLNYLMRCCSRFSPYKNFSGIKEIFPAINTNIFTQNSFAVSEQKQLLKIQETKVVVNPLITFVGDIIIGHHDGELKKTKCAKTVSYLKLKKKFDSENLSLFEQKLIKQNILTLIPSESIYNSKNSNIRTNLLYNLKKINYSESKLKEIALTLMPLTMLSGNEVNKTILWLEQIRNEIHNTRGSSPVKLKDILLGLDIFRKNKDLLRHEAQKNITEGKRYFASLLHKSLEQGRETLELTDKNINELKSIFPKPHNNQSKDYTIIFNPLKNEYDGFITYCRSSFMGIRPLSEYISQVPEDDINAYQEKEEIYVDILCTIKKSVLLKRPVTTKYAISLDGTEHHEKQTLISLDDLYIYASPKELVLYSKERNKRIIPVLTTCYLAENDTNDLYRFMASYAKQYFNDGIHFDLTWLQKNHIPRITYKNMILFPKTWFLSKENINKSINNLPEYVRLIENDKDALLKKSSPYFLDQINKSKSKTLHIQEDLTLDSQIETPSGPYLCQIAFSVKTQSQQQPLYFNEYTYNKLPLDAPIQQINIKAPEQFLELIMLDLINKQILNEKYFFINYQKPESHIRLRIINNPKIVENIIESLRRDIHYEQFCISAIERVPYEEETSTYHNSKGVKLYTDCCCILSLDYLRIKNITLKSNVGTTLSAGPVLELIYLSFLSYYLLGKHNKKNDSTVYTHPSAYQECKKIWEYLRKNRKTENPAIIQLKMIAKKQAKKIHPYVSEWNKLNETKSNKKSPSFFEDRLIHIELFRMTNGSYIETNKMALHLANNIYKEELYRAN